MRGSGQKLRGTTKVPNMEAADSGAPLPSCVRKHVRSHHPKTPPTHIPCSRLRMRPSPQSASCQSCSRLALPPHCRVRVSACRESLHFHAKPAAACTPIGRGGGAKITRADVSVCCLPHAVRQAAQCKCTRPAPAPRPAPSHSQPHTAHAHLMTVPVLVDECPGAAQRRNPAQTHRAPVGMRGQPVSTAALRAGASHTNAGLQPGDPPGLSAGHPPSW